MIVRVSALEPGRSLGAVAEQHPEPDRDEQRREREGEVAGRDPLLQRGSDEDAADGRNADERGPREVDLSLDRVERRSDRRRDHDRGERGAGRLAGREAGEHHQQRHGDDAATDAEQRAEQTRDEADRDDLEEGRVQPPRRRGLRLRVGARSVDVGVALTFAAGRYPSPPTARSRRC